MTEAPGGSKETVHTLDHGRVSREDGGDVKTPKVKHCRDVEDGEGGVVEAKLGEEVVEDDVELEPAGDVGGGPGDDGDALLPALSGAEHSKPDLCPAAGGEGEEVPGGEVGADLLLYVGTEVRQQHLLTWHQSLTRTTN